MSPEVKDVGGGSYFFNTQVKTSKPPAVLSNLLPENYHLRCYSTGQIFSPFSTKICLTVHTPCENISPNKVLSQESHEANRTKRVLEASKNQLRSQLNTKQLSSGEQHGGRFKVSFVFWHQWTRVVRRQVLKVRFPV